MRLIGKLADSLCVLRLRNQHGKKAQRKRALPSAATSDSLQERAIGVAVLFLSCLNLPLEEEEEEEDDSGRREEEEEEGAVVADMLSMLEDKDLWESDNWAEEVARYAESTRQFRKVQCPSPLMLKPLGGSSNFSELDCLFSTSRTLRKRCHTRQGCFKPADQGGEERRRRTTDTE